MRCRILVPVILAVCVLWTWILPAAGQAPAPSENAASGTPTFRPTLQKDDDPVFDAFYKRVYMDAYVTKGKRSSKWDTAAQRFLRHHMQFQKYARTCLYYPDVLPPNSLLKEGKALMDVGCSDALVTACYGIDLEMARRRMKADPILRKAESLLVGSSYANCIRMLVAVNMARGTRVPGIMGDQERRRLREEAVEFFLASLSEGVFLPTELPVVMDLSQWVFLLDEIPLDEMIEGIKKQEKLDPYIADVLLGRCYLALGWKARGQGWWNEVTEEGWKGFRENTGKARDLLKAAWKAHPEYPYAPTYMIAVEGTGVAGDDETEKAWLDRMRAAQLDYMEGYRTYVSAINWRGQGDRWQMYHFGAECAAEGRFDTSIPLLFLYMLRRMDDSVVGLSEAWGTPESREVLKTIVQKYSLEPDANPYFVKTLKAGIAWKLRNLDESRALFVELGDNLQQDMVNPLFGKYPDQIRDELGLPNEEEE